MESPHVMDNCIYIFNNETTVAITQVESCDSELISLREPSFRTARQRALAEGNDEDELEMLEFGRR